MKDEKLMHHGSCVALLVLAVLCGLVSASGAQQPPAAVEDQLVQCQAAVLIQRDRAEHAENVATDLLQRRMQTQKDLERAGKEPPPEPDINDDTSRKGK